MRATDGTSRTLLWDPSEYRLSIERALAGSTILVFAIALFLLARRATGALTTSPPAPQLLVTAAAVFAWAVAIRELSAKQQMYAWLSLAALLIFAVACSYPGDRLIDWIVWLTVLLGFVALPRLRGVPKSAGPIRDPQHRSAAIDSSPPSENEQVLQNLTRSRGAAGHDIIRGELTAQFAFGERQATLYVAFCPPFERLPHVEANIADDADASIKLAQVLHNGAQLEVRLAHPAQNTMNVTVELFATDADAK